MGDLTGITAFRVKKNGSYFIEIRNNFRNQSYVELIPCDPPKPRYSLLWAPPQDGSTSSTKYSPQRQRKTHGNVFTDDNNKKWSAEDIARHCNCAVNAAQNRMWKHVNGIDTKVLQVLKEGARGYKKWYF